MSGVQDLKKLKVAELREELKARGLESKGNKAQLVKRLEKAIAAEAGAEPTADSSLDASYLESSELDTSQEEEAAAPVTEETPQAAEAEPEPAPAATEPEPAVVEQQAAEPEVAKVAEEPEPVSAEPEEPVAIEPEPVASEPEPVAAEPEPAADEAEPTPVAEEPEPAAQELEEEAQQTEESAPVAEESEDAGAEPSAVAPEEQEQKTQAEPEPNAEKTQNGDVVEAASETEPVADTKPAAEEAELANEDKAESQDQPAAEPESKPQEETETKPVEMEEKESSEDTASAAVTGETNGQETTAMETTTETEQTQEQSSEKMETTEVAAAATTGEEAQAAVEGEEFQVMDSVGGEEEQKPEDDRRGRKRQHSDHHRRSRHSRSRSRSRSPRRRRSHSPDHHRHEPRRRSRSRSPSPYERRHREPIEMDNEDWLNNTNVIFDRYNCDLNLRVDEAGFKCCPITVEGFAFMWAGARSNYGFNKGKVAFETKILENLNVSHLPPEETSRHVVRVGVSTDTNSMQLGEEKFSYGYGGTSKASTDCKFEDYGQKFGEGDVIGTFIDFESDPIQISYTKNGEDLGKCFEVEASSLEGKALFPHVLSKNCEFECNFGQREQPYFALKEDFTFVNDIPKEDRVRGSLPPAKKEDCEVIMMCGLPGSGKTTWATKYAAEHQELRVNVLGTNNIIEKMKVMGLPRKRNYAGRWDVLIDKSTKCLNRLLEIAAKKKRNYVLDQTNVYPTAQRRKLRAFEGFQRRAVVIVPTDEEFKRRVEQREKEEGKDVPEMAVFEMKANFMLPEEGTVFDKVEFIELDREEAQKLVEQYNKEGAAALPPPEKRYQNDRDRYGSRWGGRDYRGGARDYYGRGGYGGGRYDRDRSHDHGRGRWGYDNRRGGRGSYMGYSDRDRERVKGKDHHGKDDSVSRYQGSWNRNPGSWGNQGGWGNQGNWGNQGSWGNQGWGGQNYQGGWGQQWSGYGQGQQGSGGYNYNQGYYNQGNWNQGSWPGYNQNQNYSSYYGSGSNTSGSASGSGSSYNYSSQK